MKIKGKMRCRGLTLIRTPKGTSHCGIKLWLQDASFGVRLANVVRQ